MSDTPRTDAWIMSDDENLVDFARQLERELNQWREFAEELARSVRHIGWTSCEEGAVIKQTEAALAKFDTLKKGTQPTHPEIHCVRCAKPIPHSDYRYTSVYAGDPERHDGPFCAPCIRETADKCQRIIQHP